MVKVEKGKEDGGKESKKNLKGCDVMALIALIREMELEVVKNAQKKGEISILSMSFRSYYSIGVFWKKKSILDLGLLEAKENFHIQIRAN
jgi:hypothetical protein